MFFKPENRRYVRKIKAVCESNASHPENGWLLKPAVTADQRLSDASHPENGWLLKRVWT